MSAMFRLSIIPFCLMLCCITEGAILHVPGTYGSIQSAIDAAQPGDTVLVAPGTYFENIDFSGKRILVASNFALTHSVSDIEQTIIDGSHSSRPDTASVVLFVHGEDTTSVLMGFTLTGGTGTVWRDIHNGSRYREGGGILCELSSPVIRNNFIVNNSAVNLAGVTSAGGGGIRCGDGNPRILNNYITDNRGRYGAGIVLNYTAAIIRNNVVFHNSGGEDYGGAGIWAYANGAGPKLIENNTITENTSSLDGGGVYIWSTSAIIHNTIIWGNIAPSQSQIGKSSASVTVTYSDIQGGSAGTGNTAVDPQFTDTSHYLAPSSPCIDAGDTNAIYDDPADSLNPVNARRPARGGLRNDMGAFGGPGAGATVYNDLHHNDPLPPSPFSAYSDYRQPTSAVLHWLDPSATRNGLPISNFKIHLYRDSVFIAQVDSGVMSYTDTGLVKHHHYTFMARTIVPLDSGSASFSSCYAGGSAIPQRPSSFSVRDGEDGAYLTWVNPSRQIDSTPLNDFGAVLIYRDGARADSVIQTAADTGQARTYVDTARGYHWYALGTRDTESPLNTSSRTDSILAYSRTGREYHEDFEHGAGLLYRSNQWDTTHAISYRGGASLTDSPHGNSPTGTTSYVFLPPVILTNESTFRFYHIAIVNPGSSVSSVDVSVNNRRTFTSLATYSWNSYPAWSDGKADSADWRQESFDLNPYLYDTVTVRLRLVATFGSTGDGWYIDSINIGPSNPVITSTFSLDSSWNLLSLPVRTVQHKRQELYESATSPAFAYSGSYLPIDSLTTGLGFWLKFDTAASVQLTGRTVTQDNIPVSKGWNLVGALTTPLDLSAIRTNPPGIPLSGFYEFHGHYVQTTTLSPGFGCWVRAKQAGALILRSSPSAAPGQSPGFLNVPESIDGDNRLTFTDAAGETQTLTFELAADHTMPSLEAFEYPPVPPEGVFDVRFATQKSRALFETSARRDVAVSLQGIRNPLTVTWRMNPDDHGTWMFLWDSLRIPLGGSGSIRTENTPHQAILRLLSGEEREIPRRYSLDQNYPNPFNPITQINYALPEQAHVKLLVYNVLGRQIASLVDKVEEGGYKTVTFDASSLPSGVFCYRLMAGDFVSVKKMVVVK